jgi:hypothetical protein
MNIQSVASFQHPSSGHKSCTVLPRDERPTSTSLVHGVLKSLQRDMKPVLMMCNGCSARRPPPQFQLIYSIENTYILDILLGSHSESIKTIAAICLAASLFAALYVFAFIAFDARNASVPRLSYVFFKTTTLQKFGSTQRVSMTKAASFLLQSWQVG